MRRAAIPLLLLCVAAAGAIAQQARPRLILVDSAPLRAPRLTESSGVAESSRRPGVFWTHNDSGDRAFLYATDSSGADLGRVELRFVRAIDWEDLGLGPCPVSDGTCLFVGDIGDNGQSRRTVRVYAVPEPEPPASRGDTLGTVDYESVIELRYPDRARNSEALAVHRRELFLITKDRSGSPLLYRASTVAAGVQELERVAELPIETSAIRGRVVTGAAISGDGALLAVRTYVSMHLFDLRRDRAPLTGPNGIAIPVIEMQGEAVAFDSQGRLVLTSEGGVGRKPIIARVRIEGTTR